MFTPSTYMNEFGKKSEKIVKHNKELFKEELKSDMCKSLKKDRGRGYYKHLPFLKFLALVGFHLTVNYCTVEPL